MPAKRRAAQSELFAAFSCDIGYASNLIWLGEFSKRPPCLRLVRVHTLVSRS